VTWSRDLTAPAIVDYQHIYPVRAESSGFIDSVSVQTGQRVKRDQILLRLLNDQLPAQMRDVELELERLRLEQRKLLWEQKLALAQALHRKLEVMQQRLADLRYKAGRLLVRAPADGQVVSPVDGRVEGQFVHEGQELLQIAHGKARDVRVLISQEMAEDFAAWIDRRVNVHINGRGSRPFIGRLVRTEPRALSAIRHPALSAPGGGSLPVMADPERGPDRHVLLEPRFEGLVSLSPPTDAGLRAGETGELVVVGTSRSLGRLWLELVGDWVRSLTKTRING
jgi:putative peptide zinc metalloprotease protein